METGVLYNGEDGLGATPHFCLNALCGDKHVIRTVPCNGGIFTSNRHPPLCQLLESVSACIVCIQRPMDTLVAPLAVDELLRPMSF